MIQEDMTQEERRAEIIKILYWRKFDKISNLAFEFGVSERTIQRDISKLSSRFPIYTQAGRYGGGVYLNDIYTDVPIYISETDLIILYKILDFIDNNTCVILENDEIAIFRRIVINFEKAYKNKDLINKD